MPTKEKTTEEVAVVEAPINTKGKYIATIGRRKTSVARVRLYKKGSGVFLINDSAMNEYFTPEDIVTLKGPLRLTGFIKDYDFTIVVKGGGKKGQADAIRHGIARALVEIDEDLKPVLKTKGWLASDARKKERKKPGLKKARKSPQWSKR